MYIFEFYFGIRNSSMRKIGQSQWSYSPTLPLSKRYSYLNSEYGSLSFFPQFFGLGLSTMFLRPLTSSAFHQVSLGWSCLWKVKQTIKLYTACKPEENQQSNKKEKFCPSTFNVFPHCPPTVSPVFISEVMTTTRAQFPFKLTRLSKRPCQIYQKICCFITTMHPSQPAPWKSLVQQVGLTHQSHKQDAANRNMDPGKDRLY